MFTGIVEERGEVVSRTGTRLTLRAPVASADAAIGDSIAVSGTCLTVVDRGSEVLAFDLSAETIARTNLGALAEGDPVNLERATTLASRLGGHLVQGHVDAVGEVVSAAREAGGGVRLAVRLPEDLLGYVVDRGSIALDGVSLTVAALREDVVEVALIPHTLAATSLGVRRAGDRVNVEVDVVAKYVTRTVESLMKGVARERLSVEPGQPEEERTA